MIRIAPPHTHIPVQSAKSSTSQIGSSLYFGDVSEWGKQGLHPKKGMIVALYPRQNKIPQK